MPAKKLNPQDSPFPFDVDDAVSVRIAGLEDEMPAADAIVSQQANESLPENFRYALQNEQVFIQGDLRGDIGHSIESRKRLQAIAADQLDIGNQPPGDDEVEFELATLGLEWERHDEEWRTTFTWPGGTRCELLAEATTGGVHVWAVLAKWEGDLESVCNTALIRFLGHAHARLRFARVVLAEQKALVESTAMTDRMEFELQDSVFAVASAYDLIAREVNALLLPEIASQYMEINSQ